ncbi:MAG: hypothetical protein GXP29_06785 [Planctomycetes bacterium]|nr:hypothetical protein [Planctomycetota bacterium]
MRFLGVYVCVICRPSSPDDATLHAGALPSIEGRAMLDRCAAPDARRFCLWASSGAGKVSDVAASERCTLA